MRRCGEEMNTNDGAPYLCRVPVTAEGEVPHRHAICGDTEHRHGSAPCWLFGDRKGEHGGAMLAAVQADLARVPIDQVPGGRTHQAMAFWLAGVIDKRGGDDGPSTTAKLADQLGKVMAALTKGAPTGDGKDPFDEFSEHASTPSMD